MKSAVVVLSDPNSGSEESLGRVFNALAAAHDFNARGEDVQIYFQGAGTRWPVELAKPEHPVHGLFAEVKHLVAGVSCGCADVFGSRDAVEAGGYELLTENAVPGTSGLPSVAAMMADGYRVVTF